MRAGLDLLVRVDAHARHDHALGADHDLVADRDAVLEPRVRPDVARAADDRALHERAPSEVRRRVDDRAGRSRALAQRHARAEHGVLADGGAGRDAAVVADERRRLDLLEFWEVHPLPDPDVPPQADARNAEAHVLVEVADVLPVAVHHVAVERPPHLEQQREELLREVEWTVVRDVPQHLGLEHVDARVDRVREDLAPGRLLEKTLDPRVLVGDDDPELERVLDRLQPDRDGRAFLLVELDERGKVEVAEGVARDDEEGLVEAVAREPYRAGRPQRRFLDRVLDCHPERLAGPEVAADGLREEGQRHYDLVEAVLVEQLEDVLHARLADDRDHGFRLVGGQRPEARSFASRHHDGFHAHLTSLRAFSAYTPSDATASPKPVQKIHSGHLASGSVTMTKASEA